MTNETSTTGRLSIYEMECKLISRCALGDRYTDLATIVHQEGTHFSIDQRAEFRAFAWGAIKMRNAIAAGAES
jgi:hypothetical protein